MQLLDYNKNSFTLENWNKLHWTSFSIQICLIKENSVFSSNEMLDLFKRILRLAHFLFLHKKYILLT